MLSEGPHTIEVELYLENDDETSTDADSVEVSVLSTIREIESLSFTFEGPATTKYTGKLTYLTVDLSTGNFIAEGNLGDSSESFSSLTLQTPFSAGESLRLQEPIQINVT